MTGTRRQPRVRDRWGRILIGTLFLTGVAAWGDAQQRLLGAGSRALDEGLPYVAEKYLRALLDEGETLPAERRFQTQLLLARSQAAQGREDEALSRFESLRSESGLSDAQRIRLHYWHGRTLLMAGRASEAVELLSEASPDEETEELPEFRPVLRLLGYAHAEAGDPVSARAIYQDYDQRFGTLPGAEQNLLQWMQLEQVEGAYDRVLELVEELEERLETTEEGPARLQIRSEARWIVAEMAYDRGDFDTVLEESKLISAAERVDPTLRAQARVLEGDLWAQRGDHTKAQAIFASVDSLVRGTPLAREATLRECMAQASMGQVSQAVERVHAHLRTYPDPESAADAQLRMSEHLKEQGAYTAALDEFQAYLERFSDVRGQFRATMGKGQSYEGLEKWEMAADTFRKAGADTPVDAERAEALLAEASACFDGGLFERAADRYEAFLTGFPDHARFFEAKLAAAESALLLGNPEQADEVLEEVERKGAPAMALQASFRRAEILEAGEAFGAALQKYESLEPALKDPDSDSETRLVGGSAKLRRGILLYRLADYGAALEQFDALVDCGVTSVEVQSEGWRCRTLHAMGREEEAFEQALALADRFPDFPDEAAQLLFWRAQHLFNARSMNAARDSFEFLAVSFPAHRLAAESLYWAGRAAAADNALDPAKALYARLVRAYPDAEILPRAHFAWGEVLTEQGTFDEAILQYRKAASLDASTGGALSRRALGRIGDCHFSLGSRDPDRYREALGVFESLAAEPDLRLEERLQVAYKLGRCHEQLGETDAAIDRYEDVVYKLFPAYTDPGERALGAVWFTRSAFALAKIFETRGDDLEARTVYESVITQRVPAQDQARQRRAELFPEER